MDEKYCNEGCKYGLWSYEEEGYATRSCTCCGKISTYPINDYIKQEISKQKISNKAVDFFLNIPMDDINIYGYLYQIINEFINFVNKDKKTLINQKLLSMLETGIIYGKDAELSTCNIINYIKTDNLSSDDFFEELDNFKNHLISLNNILLENKSTYSK